MAADSSLNVEGIDKALKKRKADPERFIAKVKPKYDPKSEKFSREARNLVNLEMSDARALKNRLRIISIRDLVNLYKEFSQTYKTENLFVAIKDCLISERKTKKFIEQIQELCEASAPMNGIKTDAETKKMKK